MLLFILHLKTERLLLLEYLHYLLSILLLIKIELYLDAADWDELAQLEEGELLSFDVKLDSLKYVWRQLAKSELRDALLELLDVSVELSDCGLQINGLNFGNILWLIGHLAELFGELKQRDLKESLGDIQRYQILGSSLNKSQSNSH